MRIDGCTTAAETVELLRKVKEQLVKNKQLPRDPPTGAG